MKKIYITLETRGRSTANCAAAPEAHLKNQKRQFSK